MNTRSLYLVIVALALALCAARAEAEAPYQVQWVRQLGSAAEDIGRGVAADKLGNVYITGWTLGSLVAPNPAGLRTPFLAKYDSTGNRQWVRQGESVAGFGYVGFKVSADDLGNVFVTTGRGGSESAPTIPPRLYNYDADGVVRWSTPLPNQQISGAVVADNLGHAYVASYEASTNIFLRKFDDQTGSLLWTRSLDTGGTANTSTVCVDGLGHIYVAAYTNGSTIGPSAGGHDGVVAKYSDAGDLLWAKQFGSAGTDFNFQVAADALGNVWSTGGTFGDLGGPYAGGQDAYLAKHDAAGNLQWIRHLGTSGEEINGKVWADGLGNVFLATSSTGSLGGPNLGGEDIVLAKYDADGNQLWIKQFGTSGNEMPSGGGITGDGLGNIYLTGRTSSAWGGPNAGGDDVVLIKLSLAPGDFNGDGTVDALDLGAWEPAFGLTAAADADKDGDSDGFDFLAWQRNLAPRQLAAGTNSAVPEPSALALTVPALALFARRRRARPNGASA